MTLIGDWGIDALGVLGVALYIGGYALLMAGILRGNGYAYASLNGTGAALILVSLSQSFNLAAALTQISFLAISIGGLVRLYLANRRIRFTPEEAALCDRLFPDLRAELKRQFLDHGAWIDGQSGMTLTEDGAPVETLYYMMDGRAEARTGNRLLGTITDGFIGEMGAVENRPASATVQLTEPSRLFALSYGALRSMRKRSSELRFALDARMSEDTARKLVAVNERLGKTGRKRPK